jgi:uroporphyrinogen-III synthase
VRVLITRPEEDAQETAIQLESLGHQAVVAPLLSVKFRDVPLPSLGDIQGLLITSANGIRAFARISSRRDVTIAAVGPQSAQAANDLGFGDVHCADGDVTRLAERIPEWFLPGSGALLHATGTPGESTLASRLRKIGFDVRTSELYEVQARESLPLQISSALQQGGLDACLFFSPRSGRIFCESVSRQGLERSCERLVAVCISGATARALTLNFREVRTAAQPNQLALLGCLG